MNNLSAHQKLARWEARFQEPQTIILVAEDQGEICGFCFGGESRDRDVNPALCCELQAIYLSSEKWRKGIGRLLCSAALKEFRQRGYSEVSLWVLRQNQRARDFYEHMGFTPDGKTKLKTKEPGLQLDEVRYRRLLD